LIDRLIDKQSNPTMIHSIHSNLAPLAAQGLEQRALANALGRAKPLIDTLKLLQARCGFYSVCVGM
jgi:hypothetical protein